MKKLTFMKSPRVRKTLNISTTFRKLYLILEILHMKLHSHVVYSTNDISFSTALKSSDKILRLFLMNQRQLHDLSTRRSFTKYLCLPLQLSCLLLFFPSFFRSYSWPQHNYPSPDGIPGNTMILVREGFPFRVLSLEQEDHRSHQTVVGLHPCPSLFSVPHR